MLVLPTFPTSSMITGTMPAAPEVSPNLWRWLKKSDSPTLSTGKDFKPVLPKFLIEDILCTHAVCVCNKWAGKVFASLIKLSILSNTKLGNQLCSKTLLCEQQFIVVSAYHSKAILHVYGSKFTIGKLTVSVRTHFRGQTYMVFTCVMCSLVFAWGACSRCVSAYFGVA